MKRKLNKGIIQEDLNKVLYEMNEESFCNYKNDLRTSLGKLGYPYNIDDNEWKFSITISPGVYVLGKFYSSCLDLEIKYGGITARLGDLSLRWAIHYHPAGLSGYGEIFATLEKK